MTNKNLNLNALEQYVSPGIKTLSLQSEGVLCGSTITGENNTIDNATLDEWGDL